MAGSERQADELEAMELGAADWSMALDGAVMESVDRDVGCDMSVEQGGVLVGQVEPGTRSVWIRHSIVAVGAVSKPASFTFTHEAWNHIHAVIDASPSDLEIVGWYHSHPDYGVFLSEHDLFIHRHFFPQPFHVALVVDPLRATSGWFGWADGQIEPIVM